MLVQVFTEDIYNTIWKYIAMFDALPLIMKYNLIASILGLFWLVWFLSRKHSSNPRNASPEKKKKSKHTGTRKFTTDGYYWDPKKNKWIAPDYEYIPSDYH